MLAKASHKRWALIVGRFYWCCAWRGYQTSEKERGTDPGEVKSINPKEWIIETYSKAGMSDRVKVHVAP
jgi:hypothetical protein